MAASNAILRGADTKNTGKHKTNKFLDLDKNVLNLIVNK